MGSWTFPLPRTSTEEIAETVVAKYTKTVSPTSETDNVGGKVRYTFIFRKAPSHFEVHLNFRMPISMAEGIDLI